MCHKVIYTRKKREYNYRNNYTSKMVVATWVSFSISTSIISVHVYSISCRVHDINQTHLILCINFFLVLHKQLLLFQLCIMLVYVNHIYLDRQCNWKVRVNTMHDILLEWKVHLSGAKVCSKICTEQLYALQTVYLIGRFLYLVS